MHARYRHRVTNPHEAARRHVVENVLMCPEHMTVEATRDRIMSGKGYDILDVVLVLDGHGRYAGVAELRSILTSRNGTRLGEIARHDWPSVEPEADQEHAVEAANAAGVTTLPVVGREGRPLGCMTARAMLNVLAAEHREDVHRMAGILRENSGARHALEDPPVQRFARRMPWLLVGLGLSTAGTALMAGFETMLKDNVAISFFIPALVYLTDAIGTQTEAVAVRGLSLGQLPLGRILMGETATGGLIGATLGALAMLGIWLIFGDARLALAVGFSLLTAGMLASVIGLSLPWALSRFEIDPAYGSGPVATIIQDVLTILVYFVILSFVLPTVAVGP